jgi:hypothetical protein
VLSQEDDTDNDDEGGQPLLFAYSAGSRGSDWHYPVDFCGGLYRYTDIVAMLDCVPAYADIFTHAASADGTLRILLCELRWAEQLFVLPCLFFASFAGESSLKLNPNILEVELNRVFWQTQSPTGSNNAVVRHPSTGIAGDGVDLGAVTAGRELVSSPFQHSYAHALCLSADVLCVVTVNRVQTTYNVPIYASVASSTKKDDNDNDECTSTVANGDNNIIAICDGSEESLNALLCVDTNNQAPSAASSASHHEPAVRTSTYGCVKRSLDGAKYRWDCNKTSVHVGGLHFTPTQTTTPTQTQTQPQALSSRRPASEGNDVCVSVLMPVYNGARYLERAVNSVYTQAAQGPHTHLHSWMPPRRRLVIDLVIVDDGSTDESYDIAMRLQHRAQETRQQSRKSHESCVVTVQVIKLPRNVGIATALDVGLCVCKYEYVARLDCDDVCLPRADRFYKQAWYLNANPQICVVGSQAILVHEDEDEDSETHANTEARTEVAGGIHTHPVLCTFTALIRRCPLLHSTVMMRKSRVCAIGGYTGRIIDKSKAGQVTQTHMDVDAVAASNAINALIQVANADTNGGGGCGRYELGVTVTDPSLLTHSTITHGPGSNCDAVLGDGVRYIEDYMLWVRLLLRYHGDTGPCVANMADCLCAITIRPNSASRQAHDAHTASEKQYFCHFLRKHAVYEYLQPRVHSLLSSRHADSDGVQVDWSTMLECLPMLTHPETHIQSRTDYDRVMELLSHLHTMFSLQSTSRCRKDTAAAAAAVAAVEGKEDDVDTHSLGMLIDAEFADIRLRCMRALVQAVGYGHPSVASVVNSAINTADIGTSGSHGWGNGDGGVLLLKSMIPFL